MLFRSIRTRGRIDPVFLERSAELFDALPPLLRDGDVLLTLGAGDIGAIAPALPERLAANSVTELRGRGKA